jgi:signal transduction histidine kinase
VNTELAIPEFILLQLQSDYVRKQIKAFLSGSSAPSVHFVDLLDIRVILPTIEQQREVLIREMSNDISVLNAEIVRNFENYKKDIHTRKHALVQSISSLASHWNVLNNLRKRNNGIIDCSSMIGIANPIPVSSKFDAITNLINSISKFVEHLADVDYSWGADVEINMYSFIHEYIKKNTSQDFVMYNSATSENEEYIIFAPTRAIEQIFQNIVNNALSHGFTDSSRLDYQIRFEVYEEDGNVVVVISNNGNPLAKDITGEMVLTDGFSIALNENGHQGTGGAEIKTIMSKLGKVEVISNPEDTFSVSYKLTFHKTNYNY